jgi:imidazolonepropionase-like amidohydrolase
MGVITLKWKRSPLSEGPGLSMQSMTRREALTRSLAGIPLLSGAETSAAAPTPLAIARTTVIDGTGAVFSDQTVLIEGDRIRSVAKAGSVPLPTGATIVLGAGRYLIPGLWDCHAHLSYYKASALPVMLANGVTALRDMGGALSELDQWRDEIDDGVRPGPRIFRAGPILNGRQFNEFQIVVADAAEARGAVRSVNSAGVDFVKVHAAISREAYYGVEAECRRLNLPYAGHMPRAIEPEEASNAGQLSIEHIGAFADRFSSQGVSDDDMTRALIRFREEKAPALFGLFARNKTWFTPTLIASKSSIRPGDHQPDPRDRYVSASCKKITAELLMRPSYQSFLSSDSAARQTRDFNQLIPLVGLLHRQGVRLLAGTDCAVSIIYPGFSLHEELELLVAAGLKPMESLLTATANPASALGRKDLGIVRVGNLADLVLLDASPLDDIRNTRKIRAVISRGKMFGRADLDRLLEHAADEANNT